MYVLDKEGDIYLTYDWDQAGFHHTSFNGGAPVVAAGEMTVLHGRVTSISNRSGHYRPPLQSLWAVTDRLAALGVSLEGVAIVDHNAPEEAASPAGAFARTYRVWGGPSEGPPEKV